MAVELCAKGFHTKLLPRLSAYRGAWSNDAAREAPPNPESLACRKQVNSFFLHAMYVNYITCSREL